MILRNTPNILFITCDQLRCDALGCYGGSVPSSPVIDALARRGAVFDQAYVASPVCAPNRSSWATGCYPSVHGVSINGVSLPENTLTLMEALRRGGYETAMAGKLHFEPQWTQPPGYRDFDQESARGYGAINPQPKPYAMPYYGFERAAVVEDHNAGPYGEFLRAHGIDPWDDPHSATFPQHVTRRSSAPKSLSKSTWIADRSIEFIQTRDQKRPLFLWTSFVHPHHPFVVPEPFDTMFAPADMPEPVWGPEIVSRWPERLKKKYFAEVGTHESVGMHRLTDDDFKRIRAYYHGMIAHIDEQIGRILATLEEQGMSDDTLIIFSSDHGELLGDYHLLFKATHYRCVTRVPLVFVHPSIKEGRRKGFVSSIDLMPTLLELASLPLPSDLQGRSMIRCLENPDASIRSHVYIENPDIVRTLIDDHHRITWHGFEEQGELYDLEADPLELNNLWDDPGSCKLRERLKDALLSAAVQEAPRPVTRRTIF